jgi:predicted RNA-binding protein
MRYWMLSLPREDMTHCIKLGTFGLARKYVLGRVAEGDGIVCCASKEWKIIALGKATSGYYMDDRKIFLRDGSFPDRFDFQAEWLSDGQEIDLMKIIDKLSFVTNLAYWSVYFRSGIVEISGKDWVLIEQLAGTESNLSTANP